MAIADIFGKRPPYVVSSDVHGLMKQWSVQSGYTIPNERFFRQMSRELQRALREHTGAPVHVVEEDTLRRGMNKLAANSPYPVISLDKAYVDERTPNIVDHLDLTRLVDENFQKLGLHTRDGRRTLAQEVDRIAAQIQGPATLLDDVIFSGEGTIDIANAFKRKGVDIKHIITGIGIKEGLDLIKEHGMSVKSVVEYPDVKDEVCERDFVAGVPMSGRTVRHSQTGETWSAPYLQPFGDVSSWASIKPDKAEAFSDFCLRQSARLWNEVERLSDRPVRVADMPRKLKGIDGNLPASEALRQQTQVYRRTQASVVA